MMRPDFFQDKKCIHVKLDKAVHAALRAEFFKRGFSIQEVFDDYAGLIAREDVRVLRLLDQLGVRKVKERLAGAYRRGTVKPIGELDTEAIYEMIESHTNGDHR